MERIIEIGVTFQFQDPRLFFPRIVMSTQLVADHADNDVSERAAELYLAQMEYNRREYNKFLRRLDSIDLMNELGFEEDAMALEAMERARHAVQKASVTHPDPGALAEIAARDEAIRQRKARAAERARKYRMRKRLDRECKQLGNELGVIESVLRESGVDEQFIEDEAFNAYLKRNDFNDTDDE